MMQVGCLQQPLRCLIVHLLSLRLLANPTTPPPQLPAKDRMQIQSVALNWHVDRRQ